MGVEAPAGRVADDERADFEFAIGGEDAAGIAREQAGLETIFRVIDVGERLLEVLVGLDDERRGRRLLRRESSCRAGWPVRMAGVTREPLRSPPATSLAPPSTASLIQASTRSASPGRTSGPTSVASSEGSPETSCGGDFDELPEERLEYAALDEDALDADAGLPGEAESGMGGAVSALRRGRASRRG